MLYLSEMENQGSPRQKRQPRKLRSWLLSYNLAMLCVILILVIILFSSIFSLLGDMQTRTNQYQAINLLTNQLIESRTLYHQFGETSSREKREKILGDFAILNREIDISLYRLKVSYEENPKLYFLYRGMDNGLDFISHSLEQMENLDPQVQSKEYFSIYYTGDKVYPYLQDYSFNKYLSFEVEADATWMAKAQNQVSQYRTFSVFLFILIALGYSILVYKMTMRLVRPVNTMVETADQIYHGNFDGPPIPLEGPEELVYLEQNLNQMKQSLRERLDMIEQNAQLEKLIHSQELEQMKTTRELEKARYKALQSQINPHFLFNTLNIISRTALFEEANSTVDLIDSLASIFRYTLEYHDDVLLKDELEFVRQYLTIQQFRFGERLEFSISCPPEYDEVKIPPLIIQPFVENAMVHGLEPKEEGGRVDVTVIKEGKRLVLSIIDSGIGIDLEKLTQPKPNGNQHIGIKNIGDRLKLYYKGKANLSISRISENGGTSIKITLPLKTRRNG
ncbi:sensor histidine kinase [uncultured Sphaerochaeta sp.]|uniref:sensor histidine kinase n=1 Tax=uncultured Sphaerochaeta sp. TaxID=886478 RepID=UPI002A0A3E28|nr:sensor histidine kinase [uncultured Sphaerochaeta sp.]